MRLRTAWVLAASILSVAASPDMVLFDFEDVGEIAAWKLRTPNQDELVISDQYASSGESSMVFSTPAYEEGMEQWPALEATPPAQDWSGYDRLLVDMTNPGDERGLLSLYVSDSTVPFREGMSFRFDLPPRSFRRFEIPLSGLPDAVDRSDISIVHIYTQRPLTDLTVHLDNLRLMRPGEKAVDLATAFARQLAELSERSLPPLESLVEDSRRAMYESAQAAKDRAMADAELAEITTRLADLRVALAAPDLTVARIDELAFEPDRIARSLERAQSVFAFRKEFGRLPHGDSPMLVGFATSMTKLLPRDMPFEVTCARRVELAIARNEKESFQVAVMPRDGSLEDVVVSVGDLTSASGEVLPQSSIDCDVVGYVETKKRPPYEVSHVGWWPDPILDFLGPIDVEGGDLQSFWVRIQVPRDQPAGMYRGVITVSAEGAAPLTFDLSTRVHAFTLPDHSPLPTAITFFERKRQMGGPENWQSMKFAYADFLADYYIDYDSLYRQGPPDYEIIQHLHDQGRLVAFNLGNVFNAGVDADGLDAAIGATIERLRPAHEEARRRGLLEYAYIYGFDERPPEQFPMLERTAQGLRRAFPEVLLMTTSYDHSFGTDSVVKTIDAWCPLTPRFDSELAATARADGKKVWWYICCGPHNPDANWFVEYAAIESRLLMGAMTARYRPDGFLYYSLSIWNDNEPIDSGPFTQWDPVSWTVYHGDGSLLCSGPGGKPVPTVRLENYRDGLEDLAYALILEDIIRKYEARGEALTRADEAWLVEARAALVVPESLVASMAEYSRDPDALYAYRNRLGDVIDRSGVYDANPWGECFGVRGPQTR